MKLKNKKGASLIEYGMLTGLIGVLAIGTIFKTGEDIRDLFSASADAIALDSGEEVVVPGPVGPEPTDANCYSPANVGSVGQAGWTGCEGMLIADYNMVSGSASSLPVNTGGGDGSYQVTTVDGTFTFQDDGMNIFTGQVTNMAGFFAGFSGNIDIRYWDTSSVVNFSHMFGDAYDFDQDLSGWDTSSGTNFDFMFEFAISFGGVEGDLSGWDVANAVSHTSFATNSSIWNEPIWP